MIHFKERLLPNCLPHNLEIVIVNGGENTSLYHSPLTVAKFTGKLNKIKSGYFIATPRVATIMILHALIQPRVTVNIPTITQAHILHKSNGYVRDSQKNS